MKTYAFIFARGGSKGLPRKNIKHLAGKPLLGYSIETASRIPQIEKIFVSTDDKEIAAVARTYNVVVIDRPEYLALDNSPEWLAWQHAIKWVEEQFGYFELFVSLPPTAPLRATTDVEACIRKKTEETDIVITVSEAAHSPWFNMVCNTNDGYVRLLNDGENKYARRQDVPKAYNVTTVAYVAATDYILKSNHVFNGRVRAVNIPVERAIDIDTLLDFEIAEYLIEKVNCYP